MVLSERHKILRRCLEKAEGRRLFTGEGVSEESEAEEVMVGYGEEDEEEIEGSQSIGNRGTGETRNWKGWSQRELGCG